MNPSTLRCNLTLTLFTGHFAINGSTGALIVFAPLDRETISHYNLTVTASDSVDTNRKSVSINIL